MLTVFKRRREEAISVPDIWVLGQPAFKLKRDNLVFRLGVKAKDVRACEECYAQENKATAARYPSAEHSGKRLCLQHARKANIPNAPTKKRGERTLLDSRFLTSLDMAREALACAPLEEVKYIQHLVEFLARPCGNIGCEARGSKKCGRCCKVRYCSVECQTVNWAVHKQECISDGER